MPIVHVDDADLDYHLIAYDAKGRERTDDPDGTMSDVAVEAAADVTDVFVFSHGWRGDLPLADRQYQRWITAMARQQDDRQRIRRARPDFEALLVGVHWPSEPFGQEDFRDVDFGVIGGSAADEVAPAVAVEGGAAPDDEPAPDDQPAAAERPPAGAEPAGEAPSLEAEVERWAQRLDVDEDGRAALRTILQAAADDPVPPVLPDEVRDAYVALDRALGLGSDGVGAAPDADREMFDPEQAYAASFDAGAEFGLGSFVGGLLTPLKQLSFWRMKARGRSVGETGAHDLLTRLLTLPGRSDLRVHLMGHSFGCIVVTAMVAGPRSKGGPPRPVSSLMLVQGAVSLWSYCPDIPRRPGTAGYFRPLTERGDVAGPIVTTRSRHDRAVGFWYPKAAGASGDVSFAPGELPAYGGIGTFGIQGGGLDVVDREIGGPAHRYDFQPGRIYNLNGDAAITGGDVFSGAHSMIAVPEVAHAMWEAVLAAP